MDSWEACKEMCKLIIENGNHEFMAYALQNFVVAMEDETPRMALTIAKQTWKDIDKLKPES